MPLVATSSCHAHTFRFDSVHFIGNILCVLGMSVQHLLTCRCIFGNMVVRDETKSISMSSLLLVPPTALHNLSSAASLNLVKKDVWKKERKENNMQIGKKQTTTNRWNSTLKYICIDETPKLARKEIKTTLPWSIWIHIVLPSSTIFFLYFDFSALFHDPQDCMVREMYFSCQRYKFNSWHERNFDGDIICFGETPTIVIQKQRKMLKVLSWRKSSVTTLNARILLIRCCQQYQ